MTEFQIFDFNSQNVRSFVKVDRLQPVSDDELVFKNPDGLPIDYQLKHFIFLAHPPFTKIHHRLVNIFQPHLIFFRR